jgi:hypothetical protein
MAHVEVKAWLEGVSLGQYATALNKCGYDSMLALEAASRDDIEGIVQRKDIGMLVPHQKLFLHQWGKRKMRAQKEEEEETLGGMVSERPGCHKQQKTGHLPAQSVSRHAEAQPSTSCPPTPGAKTISGAVDTLLHKRSVARSILLKDLLNHARAGDSPGDCRPRLLAGKTHSTHLASIRSVTSLVF